MKKSILLVGGNSGIGAELVEYLISADAAFVTGQVFKIDGGLSNLR